MHDLALPLPTQRPEGIARCFCGEVVTNPVLESHIRSAHRMLPSVRSQVRDIKSTPEGIAVKAKKDGKHIYSSSTAPVSSRNGSSVGFSTSSQNICRVGNVAMQSPTAVREFNNSRMTGWRPVTVHNQFANCPAGFPRFTISCA
jgi:hypothetical protein